MNEKRQGWQARVLFRRHYIKFSNECKTNYVINFQVFPSLLHLFCVYFYTFIASSIPRFRFVPVLPIQRRVNYYIIKF